MVNPSETGSESEGTNRTQPDGDSSIESPNEHSTSKKTCADCGTTKTPLWRGGPAGPKSLCNACGIRSRKKRRAILGPNKGQTDENKARKGNGSIEKLGDGLKQRLCDLGRDVMMQRSTVKKQRRKLGEEEQAAMLLMALSCGSVHA